MAQINVLRDRPFRQQVELPWIMLMPASMDWRTLVKLTSCPRHTRPFPHPRVYAGNNLHQRGFTCSIFTEQDVDLALFTGKLNFVKRQSAPENTS